MAYKHISLFLNATDSELERWLDPIEELSGYNRILTPDYTNSPFWGFHPLAVRMVIRNDDYYLKNRADHFVLMYGSSEGMDPPGETNPPEVFQTCTSQWGYDDCIICLANHKGAMVITAYRFRENPKE